MLLAIDVGNTNTVLGMFNGDHLTASWRIKTDGRTTADELVLTYRGLLAGQEKVTGIALCSTVPAVLSEMRLMLDRYYIGVPTIIIEPGIKTGVPILTDNPKEVGADRIVNTLAAHQLFGGPCIVVDFGTSTNLDVVSAKGEFLGGALAPGIEFPLTHSPSAQRNCARLSWCARAHQLERTRSRRCSQGRSTVLRVKSMAWSTASARNLMS